MPAFASFGDGDSPNHQQPHGGNLMMDPAAPPAAAGGANADPRYFSNESLEDRNSSTGSMGDGINNLSVERRKVRLHRRGTCAVWPHWAMSPIIAAKKTQILLRSQTEGPDLSSKELQRLWSLL